ncbi:MAG: cytochrome c3 family protein [Planctomycetota bacterium]|jgi:c(7)-type cytochrome triheme protein
MNRRYTMLIAAMGLIALLAVGCSKKMQSTFFDGVEKGPPPPTHKVRRDLLREIGDLERELAKSQQALENARKARGTGEEKAVPPAEQVKTWAEAAELLPKDYSGHADWVQALAAGSIAPRPGVDPKTPEQAVFDFNVEFADASSDIFHVTYPHAAHTQWLACKNCHPAIFPLKRGAKPPVVTMAKLKKGKYCGVCHGKVAFAIDQGCARCHKGLPNQADWRPSEEPRTPVERARSWKEAERLLPATPVGPDWAKALVDGVIVPRTGVDPKAPDQPVFPVDVELVPADNPAFKVVYPHAAHTAVLSCATCHPAIFQMKKGADPITMAKIMAGEYCGRCHGKVAFAVPTGCPRCHQVLAGQ